MNLKDYIQKLETLVKENPECLEMDVIYSIDDEANRYDFVHFDPTPVRFDISEANEVDTNVETIENCNAVLIN